MSVVPVRSGKKRGSPSVVSPVEDTGHALTRSNLSRELFVAVVGPAGAGASTAAEFLQDAFRQRDVDGKRFKVHLVKASQIIKSKAGIESDAAPGPVRKTSEDVKRLQDLGDRLRSVDTTAIAKAMVGEIMTQRSVMTGLPEREIDGDPRVFVIDSLRHPDEVRLLRRLYGDAFALVGVVCAPAERKRRLIENRLYGKERKDEVKLAEIDAIMDRDADSDLPHGQHVTAVFELADFYVDNSSVMVEGVTGMNDDLERFVDIVAKTKVVRPTMDETAMHHAHSAQKRSACMSRQVGAALVDDQGNVVATGTNEVPRAGGGVYGEHFGFADDDRCVFKPDAKCMNNVEQNVIIENLIGALSNDLIPDIDRADLARRLRKTRIGGLIEFSRAVHAEMDAILSAARAGVSPKGKRLFVTTFPCHYCARHLVSSGVDEVQYIEPYPKSLAVELHADSIGSDRQRWKRPSEQRMVVEGVRAARGDDKPSVVPEPPKALFHPFVGVAPRMYAKAFVKDRDLKDKTSGLFTGPGTSNWGETFQVSQVHYTVMEAKLTGRELVGS